MASKVDIAFGEFVRLVRNGLTHEQIAEQMYIDRRTLARWMKEHGVTFSREAEDYDIMLYYGYSDKEIARKWGISPTALYMWKKSRGLV